jgi:hypothetical protein
MLVSSSDRRLTTRRLALDEWARWRSVRERITPASDVLLGRDADGRRYFEGGFPALMDHEREENRDG